MKYYEFFNLMTLFDLLLREEDNYQTKKVFYFLFLFFLKLVFGISRD